MATGENDSAAYELYIDVDENLRWQTLCRNDNCDPLRDMQPIDLTDAVVLDTRSTGFSVTDEIIEIAILDNVKLGAVFNSLVKPRCSMSDEAKDLYGITDEMLDDERPWLAIRDRVRHELSGKRILGYNVDFHLRLMAYSDQPDLDSASDYKNDVVDVMDWYATYYGDWSEYHKSYTWQSLGAALAQVRCQEWTAEQVRKIESNSPLSRCCGILSLIEAVNAKIPQHNAKQEKRREARRAANAVVMEEWQRIKPAQDIEKAKLQAKKKQADERKAARREAFLANVVSRADTYFTQAQRPAGYMTYSDICKAKRDGEKWVQVGICATAYGDKFEIYLPAA